MVLSLRYGLALGALAAALTGVAQADPIRHPTAVFAGLDKTTGRIINFDVAIDETVQFGSLNVTPRVCNTRPQTEAPQTTSFVEVDEIITKQERPGKIEAKADPKADTRQEAKRIFSGWMFASSPGLHGVEHPVYDVWLLDCKGGKEIVPPPATAGAETPAQPAAEAAPAPSADAGTPPPDAGKKKKSRKVEPKAPTPVENAPIGPADSAPPQPAMDAPPAPDAAGEAPAQPPQPRKKKRKPAAPAAQPAEPQGGGLFPF